MTEPAERGTEGEHGCGNMSGVEDAVITGVFGASKELSEGSGGRLASPRTGWGSQRHRRYTPKLDWLAASPTAVSTRTPVTG